MSTATEENSIADAMEVLRYTKIYDEHGKHISTRDSCTGIEWPTLADDEEVQPTPAASETKKAPLFYWNGIQDEEGAELQEVLYFESLDFTYPDPKGRCTVAIIEPLSGKFSPLVCSWFENDPQSDIKKWVIRFSDVERRINIGPEHPLYPQVKAAYEAQEAHSNSIFEAAKKGIEDASKEVAA
ncbi:hypothetical protein [Xylella fastidiosa]|uniref:hypothetical protein n=1 Tax=Xylella fastidiosa TaxID=2371 RepID=UPI0012B25CA8|nr:hypothetical protein [Xylella fastidiosa]MDC6412881.1 hypothetical protein [Xylella fastidiosa subsp. multiplex]MDD0863768.1 hypothetical protein [Xylella fastidiosa subsp. multiplex]MDD0866362.1 hypothetical protein [Xylella fastidiosa subsp. multiplex]MDD0872571.1 hypothetical protein [Xylella fastidiosa subsp. multiplex]MDD0874926.1 hypothetical protein [Xylella fastidiosa subsp. multiplex]